MQKIFNMEGKTINGYTLQRRLGVGGMAEVWYAENRIHKAAAVKLLNDDLSRNAAIVERFENEAEIMVKLDHDNIRQVYDFGELDGRPAIIMEYLEGDDLKARMKHGQRFTDEELIKWWNQLVDALNYTHKKGIIHRDIKPGNIFVDTEGNIKLLDFGIAKVRESISATQTGQKLGTLMYMSPEQVRDSKHIDYHTDNYSLAVTFVHLLTGKKPYDSDTSSDFDIQLSIVTKPLDMNEVPEKWRGFLAQYLEKEPAQRAELKPFEAISSKNEAEPVAEKPVPTPIKHESDETIVDIPVEPKKETREEKSTKDNLQQEELPIEEKPKTNDKKKKVWIWLGLFAAFELSIIMAIGNIYPMPLCLGVLVFLQFGVFLLLSLRFLKHFNNKVKDLPWKVAVYSIIVFAVALVCRFIDYTANTLIITSILYYLLVIGAMISLACVFYYKPVKFKAFPYFIVAVMGLWFVFEGGLFFILEWRQGYYTYFGAWLSYSRISRLAIPIIAWFVLAMKKKSIKQ